MKTFTMVKTLLFLQIFSIFHSQTNGFIFYDWYNSDNKATTTTSTEKSRDVTTLRDIILRNKTFSEMGSSLGITETTYKNIIVSLKRETYTPITTNSQGIKTIFKTSSTNSFRFPYYYIKPASKNISTLSPFNIKLSQRNETLFPETIFPKPYTSTIKTNILTHDYVSLTTESKVLSFNYKQQMAKVKLITEEYKPSIEKLNTLSPKYEKFSSGKNKLIKDFLTSTTIQLPSKYEARNNKDIFQKKDTEFFKSKTLKKNHGPPTINPSTPIPQKFGIVSSNLFTLKEMVTPAYRLKKEMMKHGSSKRRNRANSGKIKNNAFLRQNNFSTKRYSHTIPNQIFQKSQTTLRTRYNKKQTKTPTFLFKSSISTPFKTKTIIKKPKNQRQILNTTTLISSKKYKSFLSEKSQIKISTKKFNIIDSNTQKSITSKNKLIKQFKENVERDKQKVSMEGNRRHIHDNQSPIVVSFEQSIVLVSSLNRNEKKANNNNNNPEKIYVPPKDISNMLTHTILSKTNVSAKESEVLFLKVENGKEVSTRKVISFSNSSFTTNVSNKIITTMESTKSVTENFKISPKKGFVTPSFLNKSNKLKSTTMKSSTIVTEYFVTRSNVRWMHRDIAKDDSSFHMVCSLGKDEGDGSETISAWYYNSYTRRCEWFIYGGSNGNGNRFNYRANCENYCIYKNDDFCGREDIVLCKERWLTCKMEYDQYCNDEVSGTEKVPMIFCPPQQPICISRKGVFRKPPVYLTHRNMIPKECQQKKDPGLCLRNNNSVLVFHYDKKYNDCFGFIYSKCGGNSNRFPNKEECMNHCAI